MPSRPRGRTLSQTLLMNLRRFNRFWVRERGDGPRQLASRDGSYQDDGADIFPWDSVEPNWTAVENQNQAITPLSTEPYEWMFKSFFIQSEMMGIFSHEDCFVHKVWYYGVNADDRIIYACLEPTRQPQSEPVFPILRLVLTPFIWREVDGEVLIQVVPPEQGERGGRFFSIPWGSEEMQSDTLLKFATKIMMNDPIFDEPKQWRLIRDIYGKLSSKLKWIAMLNLLLHFRDGAITAQIVVPWGEVMPSVNRFPPTCGVPLLPQPSDRPLTLRPQPRGFVAHAGPSYEHSQSRPEPEEFPEWNRRYAAGPQMPRRPFSWESAANELGSNANMVNELGSTESVAIDSNHDESAANVPSLRDLPVRDASRLAVMVPGEESHRLVSLVASLSVDGSEIRSPTDAGVSSSSGSRRVSVNAEARSTPALSEVDLVSPIQGPWDRPF